MTGNRVVALRQKGAIDDPLTEILRTGARRLIAKAVEAEFETFLGSTAELVLADGRRRVVRHGHDPVRAIQTGIGPIEVQRPKARDRAAASGERVRFTSNILPKWARRTRSLDALLPVLYLRGISAGDFQEALAALLGKDAPNLVSMPSWELFDAQPRSYRDQVFLPAVHARLAVEAGASQGWHRYVGGRGDVLGVDRYGASAPGDVVMREYGFTVDNVCKRAMTLLG